MAQLLAEVKRIAILALDWIFWLILWVWNKSIGQIGQAVSLDFKSLPDWKAALYVVLLLLLAYLLYSIVPTIISGVARVFSAIWGFVETIIKVLIANIWVLLAAYGAALMINTFKWGAIVGKLPWQ